MTAAEMDAVLEPRLQLHESVEIYYIVTDWNAVFNTNDGSKRVAEGVGSTPLKAVEDLCRILKETTPAVPGAGGR